VRTLRNGLPLQCADGEVDAGEAGYFTALSKPALNGMIDVVKGIEPELGYGAIFSSPKWKHHARVAYKEDEDRVCTYCGVGCSFDIWTKGRHIQSGPTHGRRMACRRAQGNVRWTNVTARPADKPEFARAEGREASCGRRRWAWWCGTIREISAANGRTALASISSSKCTNEESYLIAELARAVDRPNHG